MSRLHPHPDLTTRLLGNETLIFDKVSGAVHHLDAIGSTVWAAIAAGCDSEDLPDATGLSPQEAQAAVAALVDAALIDVDMDPKLFSRRTMLARAGLVGGAAIVTTVLLPAASASATGNPSIPPSGSMSAGQGMVYNTPSVATQYQFTLIGGAGGGGGTLGSTVGGTGGRGVKLVVDVTLAPGGSLVLAAGSGGKAGSNGAAGAGGAGGQSLTAVGPNAFYTGGNGAAGAAALAPVSAGSAGGGGGGSLSYIIGSGISLVAPGGGGGDGAGSLASARAGGDGTTTNDTSNEAGSGTAANANTAAGKGGGGAGSPGGAAGSLAAASAGGAPYSDSTTSLVISVFGSVTAAGSDGADGSVSFEQTS